MSSLIKKIKILHLEDLASDAELVARELKKAGLEFELRWVANEIEFTRALTEFSPDIILSDHSLPSFNSLGALKIVHELKITVPFILITSTTSEEIAVSVMKEGAWDYILKDRMTRLPIAIESAIKKWKLEKERENYLEQMMRDERKFRGMIENSYDIISLLTKDFESLYRSPSTERMTGWTDEDRKHVGEIMHPEDIENCKSVFKEACLKPGISFPLSFRVRHKNGQYLWIEGVITNMLHDEAINGIITNFHDVTETKLAQRQLEESLRQVNFHLDNSPLGFIEWDNQFFVKKMSERAEGIFGWTTMEYLELQKAAHVGVHPEDYTLAEKMARELMTGIARNHFQKRLITKAGKVIWTEWFNSILKNASGEIVTVMSLVSDITDKKETEIKIRESEANLLSIMENSDVIIYSLNRNFEYITFNSALKDAVKAAYNLDVAVGDNAFEFLQNITPAEAAEWQAIYTKALSGEHLLFEKKFSLGNFYRFNSFSINPIIANEKVIGVTCFVHDITDEKLSQEKILAHEKRFRSLIENISDGIVLTDKDQKLIYQSPSVEKILGYSEQERMHSSVLNYVREDYLESFRELCSHVLIDNLNPHSFELPYRHKNGNYVWLEGVITNLLDDPNVQGVVANYRDVTEHKKMNDLLKEYNDRHEIVSKATNDAIWDWNIETDYAVWNHGMESIFGYPTREMHDIKNWQKSKIHPEDYERIQHEIKTAFTEKVENWTSRYQYLCSNGNYKHVLDRARILYDGDKPHRMIGAMQDITEQVVSEQMVRSLKERYEIVLDTTGDAVWDWDLMDDTIVWGNGISRLFGYHVHDKVSITFWNEKIHEDDLNRTLEFINEVSGDPEKNRWEVQYRFRKSDGSYAFVQDMGTVIRDKNGKAVRMVGAMQDISERIRSMEEIKKLSLVASKTSNAVIIADQHGLIEWVNEGFVKLCGYQLDEVKGRRASFLEGPETDYAITTRISEKLKKREFISEEIVNYTKNGSKYWSKLDIAPIFDDNHELKNFISIQTDITELKQFEQSITGIARELSELIEHANVPIFGIDRNGYINEWNRTAALLSGYDKNEVLGQKWKTFLNQEIHRGVGIVLERALEGNPVSNFELPFITKKGDHLTLFVSASTRFDINKKIKGVLCVGQDLTELIQYRQGLEKLVVERTRDLNEALNKEKELVEMKSKFVSIASHEFRTPLSTISLVSGFLGKHREKLNPAEFNLKLASIDKQVNHMTYMLDDILMIGKIEAGKIQPQIKPVAIVQFIQQLCQEVEQTSQTHTINIQDNCSVAEINADEKLLRNIIINLLTNAIKFSPQANTVFVRISNSKDNLKLEVEDQGIGIAKEDIATTFTAFNRGSNVGTIQGTGLGLSIVKKAVELLHGEVTLTSEVNHGTSFTITLPLRAT